MGLPGPVSLSKEPPATALAAATGAAEAAAPAGPAWIVIPVRVVALVVLVPVRLVHDLAVLAGRGLRALMRIPVGLVRLIGSGLAWLFGVLLVLLSPVGRFFAALGRGIARVLGFVLLRPLLVLGRGLAWLGRGVLLLFKGIGLLFRGIGLGFGQLLTVLVVTPAVLLWHYVLRPPLRIVWRYVLSPICQGVAGTWRLAGRFLRWLWLVLVVVPARWGGRAGRVLIVEPARWVRTSVLRPIGNAVRNMWRVYVRDPYRSARRTMRETSREVRLTLRRTFRGR
ncbi:hypothetical protein [Actinomadura rubrisoli]|uniref:Uncharacterized protein n=1 Tax=Actinomadura rubrisoli TaxID=2530368 RepID=A0A4R5C5F9_9ACTN|nr:hypothetical protein [Actinomadura rubrisoli]TDD92102.1 hypothetical protein E1298_11155 [Actinomadura rubrisoli]